MGGAEEAAAVGSRRGQLERRHGAHGKQDAGEEEEAAQAAQPRRSLLHGGVRGEPAPGVGKWKLLIFGAA